MHQLSRFKTRHVVLFCVILSLTVVETTYADTVRYIVEPVTLAHGYAITGGFIETNGTMGSLAPLDITDYEISVVGSFPFVFQPVKHGAKVFIEGNVLASTETITISRSEIGQVFPFNILLFFANDDNGDSLCSGDCLQILRWNGWDRDDVEIIYHYVDTIGGDPDEFSNTWIGNPVVIATVPEPTSTTLCLTAVLFGAGMGRWRKRKR